MFAMLPRAHLVDFHLCLEDFLLCDIVFILFNADHCLLRCSAEVLCEGLRHEAAGQVKSLDTVVQPYLAEEVDLGQDALTGVKVEP